MSNFRNGKPALSIVAAGRNDDHGGNLLRRMQMFINGILAQSQQYRLSVEIVLVEWNPPQERPRLAEVLPFPERSDYCTIRIIQVPAEVHNRYKHADGLALYQMIAKNVGIRRAQGEFILATNIDILFSDELFAFFASGKMTRGKIYRVDRYDVNNKVLQQPTVSDQLAFCRENIIRINKRNGTQNLITGDYHMIYPPEGEDVPRLRTKRAHLHTNGCGDFQLLHRDHWFSVHGYPEFDMHSFHLDSLFSFMAHYDGADEEVLNYPMCIYHIEHSAGWTPEIHKKGTLWNNLEARKVERISNAQFDAYAMTMTEQRNPIIFNDDNWGLEAEEFEEDIPVRAEFDMSNSKSAKRIVSVTESSENSGSPVSRAADEKYLSIVVASRNDDYDANILHRMLVFAKGLAEQCKRFNLNGELIIVEWNPPAGRKRLYEVLDWPDDLGPLTVRFIEVPAEVHNSIGNSDKLPLFQMIAKNVGIRRARGKFILATNIDILFSNELMQFLASGRLDENHFYRIDRHDVSSKIVPERKDINEQLEFCRNNIVRVHGLYGTKKISEMESDHFIYDSKDIKLHTNGCGDFTLMSRSNWHLFRAYPELPRWSIYVDGLLLHMAYVSGLHQVILSKPMRIYHIEHDMSWAVSDEDKQKLATERYPSLDYQKEYLVWCQRMIEAGRPITNNDENWGYAQTEFKEYVISGRWKGQMTNRNVISHDNNRKPFQEWIDTLALTQNRLYYRDQTPKSLNMLVELVHRYKPTKIVELGTLSGLSLRAWLAAKSKAEVIAIDLSFKPLFKSQEVLPVDLSGVRLLEQDILKTDFRQLWSEEDKVLLYIDAHDQPNTSIMTHILDNALPLLPPGSIVTVDDLWYYPEVLTNNSVSKFFEEVTINEIDPLQCFEGYCAPYWKGGFFVGFREVVSLVEWVNCNNVELILNPGDKTVTFECPVLRKSAGESFDIDAFKRLTGSISYNPVETVSVYGDRNVPGNKIAVALCVQGARFYACGRIKEAINCFKQAILLKSDINGAFYAQAVCFAREGNFEKAAESLRMEIKNEFCHPRAQWLYKDIQQYIRRKHKPISTGQKTGAYGNITIFALPKAFTDTFATIQENALKSWMQLRPCPEIILFGNDEGVAEFAQKYNLKHIPNVQRNEFGTPLLNDLFLKAQTAATSEICVYINADIILMSDFVEALDKVGTEFDQFLMIGRRWDIDITEPVEFDNEKWQEHLRMQVKMLGSIHLDRGIDYFAFRKGLWRQIPPFGIGRTAWDNWLVYAPLSEGKDVVDATEAVTAVHQNHNFSHITGGKETSRFKLEAQQNRKIAGRVVLMGVGAASDATWRLTKDGLVRNKPEGYNTHLNDLCSKLLEKGWDKKYNLYKKYFHSAQYLKKIKRPCISIVVISWRFHPDTVKNFEALAQQRDNNFELIFVNNGAKNDEFEDLMPFIDTYIKLNQNTGAYLARNIGALFAKAPILLFLDDDCIAETNIVEAYLRNFEKYDVIAVQGAVWPKAKGAGPYGAHRYYGSKPFPYFSCQEGNTAYKASAFYQVSGWDNEIRFGHGGIDLSRRLMEIEPDMRKQMYSPEPVIHHDPVKDKKILEEKARKQKISAKRLERKRPDFYVFQRRYNEYLQREDLLIHKDAHRGSYADMKGLDEHIYPFRDIARHNLALQRAQPDTKKLITSIKNGKELSVATDVNNQILAEESFRKGFRYLRNGDASEAIKYLEKAAKNCMTLPNLHYALAAAYAELGDIFSAQKACEMELNLQPEHSGARKFLERIQKALTSLAPDADSKSKVSVITSCYNCEKFLPECLESIRSQTMQEWELFLLDDGSSDSTRSIIEKYAQMDERIKPYYFQDNKGPYVRRNFAIERACSDFIAIQDADDIMCPNKLEVLYREIISDDCLAVVGAFYRSFLDEFRGLQYTDEHKFSLEHNEIIARLLNWRFSLCHGSAIIRRSLFDEIGLYDENPFASDSFWLAKAAEYAYRSGRIKLKNIPEFLMLRRMHSASQTGLLPTFDHRSRRSKFAAYCKDKFLKVREKLRNNPAADIAAELRNCKCSDFIEKYGHLFAQWESEPLNDDMLKQLIVIVVGLFNKHLCVSCIVRLEGMETMICDIAKRFKNYDLLRAMAYFALDRKQESLKYLNREIENHNSPAARKFISDYFENQLKTDLQSWCLENGRLYELRIIDLEKKSGIDRQRETVSDRRYLPQAAPSHAKTGASAPTSDRPQADRDSNCGRAGPLVSVIMPAYNAAEYITEAIKSVLNQTYKDYELVVINDGSTDRTEDIVLGFKDEKIKYLRQENIGAWGARNRAIKESKGNFIINLDTDDMMTPDFIAKHLHEFEKHPEADLIYCDDYLIEQDGKPIRVIKRREYTNRKFLIRDLFRCGFPIVPFRTCIRKTVFDKIGFFDEDLVIGGDYDMMRRFVKNDLKIHHLDGALYLRRMTPNSLSRTFNAQKAKCLFEVVKRYTETFTYEELFPDVAWDEIAPHMRQLHAKCLAAGTYLAIGQDYVKTNATECSRTALDHACSELNDCVKMNPGNQRLRQLLRKSELIRARYTEVPQQAVSK
ncbi:MAG: glycosyltransferase [Phycisphaerae bacterium]